MVQTVLLHLNSPNNFCYSWGKFVGKLLFTKIETCKNFLKIIILRKMKNGINECKAVMIVIIF